MQSMQAKGKTMKRTIWAILAVATFSFAGCVTVPANFIDTTVPIPPEGYTVCGGPVAGYCEQHWLLGVLGGSYYSQQRAAYNAALRQAPDADALISVTIDVNHSYFPLVTSMTTTVTGVPVKFNKKAEQ